MNKISEMNLTESQTKSIKQKILHKEGENLRKKRQKISIRNFAPKTIIGQGAFGEVRVCEYKPTGEIVAIKKLKKEQMHKMNQVLHIRTERDVLSEANNQWIVDLKFSFQDKKFLYLGMEFLQGGDLMNLLIQRDILPEEDAKFYAAELVMAIDSVHKLNCIHRDLKPDNILIDKYGHIKLSDFGLSKKLNYKINQNFDTTNTSVSEKEISYETQFSKYKLLNKNKRRVEAYSTVGTPDYIAPEVFTQEGYGPEVDWWSLGVIMYEMMIGFPPFKTEPASDTWKTILNWKSTLHFHKETNISEEAVDIIKKFINDPEKRLGYNGIEEIKQHPFFKGINFDKIKETLTPPFIPEIADDLDTKYFDTFEENEPFYSDDDNNSNTSENNTNNENNTNDNNKSSNTKDMCFVDFTFKKEDNFRTNMISALEEFDNLKNDINAVYVNNKSSIIEHEDVKDVPDINKIDLKDIDKPYFTNYEDKTQCNNKEHVLNNVNKSSDVNNSVFKKSIRKNNSSLIKNKNNNSTTTSKKNDIKKVSKCDYSKYKACMCSNDNKTSHMPLNKTSSKKAEIKVNSSLKYNKTPANIPTIRKKNTNSNINKKEDDKLRKTKCKYNTKSAVTKVERTDSYSTPKNDSNYKILKNEGSSQIKNEGLIQVKRNDKIMFQKKKINSKNCFKKIVQSDYYSENTNTKLNGSNLFSQRKTEDIKDNKNNHKINDDIFISNFNSNNVYQKVEVRYKKRYNLNNIKISKQCKNETKKE